MGSRKYKIQWKAHFEEKHNIFLESSEVLECIKYESVQTKKAANLLKGHAMVRAKKVFLAFGGIVSYWIGLKIVKVIVSTVNKVDAIVAQMVLLCFRDVVKRKIFATSKRLQSLVKFFY